MRTKWLTVYEGWPDTEFGSGSKSGQKPVENSGLVPYTFRWGSCSKPPGTRTPLPFLRAKEHTQPQTFAVDGRSGTLSHYRVGTLPEPA